MRIPPDLSNFSLQHQGHHLEDKLTVAMESAASGHMPLAELLGALGREMEQVLSYQEAAPAGEKWQAWREALECYLEALEQALDLVEAGKLASPAERGAVYEAASRADALLDEQPLDLQFSF
jgi:hypothetical protein